MSGSAASGAPRRTWIIASSMTQARMSRAARPANCWCARRASEPRRGFFTEYLKDEAATREAWDGGWFHTGDVVSEGADGSLFFVDRKKNIVRRSGENIAVIEVEGVLANLDGIAGVAVAPVPDETRGEEVFAMIVPRETPRDARAAGRSRSRAPAPSGSPISRCRRTSRLSTTIPITPTQKLQRGAIKALAAAAVGAPGTIDLRAFKATLRQREQSA